MAFERFGSRAEAQREAEDYALSVSEWGRTHHALRTRAETAEAQLATLRAEVEGLVLETTENDIRWFSQNVPPGLQSERYAIDRLVRDHKKIATLLSNPKADR
jgi:hypothetical protein